MATSSTTSIGGHWGDYNRDGFVDLFVTTSICEPENDVLYRNNGDGTFKKMTAAEVGPIVNYASGNDYAVWVDVDNDGWPEFSRNVRVCSSPNATNQLYHLDSQGQFDLMDIGEMATPQAGYTSISWGDYDNDGFLDAFVGVENGAMRLYRNLAGQGFSNVTASAFPDLLMKSFNGVWVDYDNDGWLDLAVYVPDGQPIALFRNNGDGTFTRRTVGGPTNSRWGLFWGDYNNDGFLDALVLNGPGKRTELFRQNGSSNHWLKVKLDGRASNRSGIGAKVRVKADIGGKTVWQMREISVEDIGLDNGLIAHFGLGDATNIDIVRIEWPAGNVQELAGVALDQLRAVTEPSLITPARPSTSLNGSVTLTRAVVSGATYQWQFDGADLVEQTNRTLNLTYIVAEQQGRYGVVVSDASTLVTNYVYLYVDRQFTKITAGPVVTDNEDSWGSVWVDYDQDGDVDLFVANGSFVGNQRNALYRNDGQGTFTRMTAATAGPIAGDVGSWIMVAWADIDNDGLPDALVTDLGRNLNALYRNVGSGMFERRLDLVPANWRSGPGPGFADFDNDGWVDWFIGSAVSGSPVRTNSLFHNVAGQAFVPVAQGPVVQDRLGDTESGMWGDYDGDGDLDLVITLGSSAPGVRLYENLGAGRFARAQTTGLEDPLGSGAFPVEAVWADYDNDTRLDLFVAVYSSTANVLFHNEGGGVFTRHLMGKAGMEQGHPAWADYDNDGWLDLFLARGQGSLTPDQLWHNNGDGTFAEVTTGSLVTTPGNSEGAAWGDYDNDGFLDLFVANGYVNGRNSLYHNNGNSNHWLKVELKGTTSNRSAIGAKVKVRATISGRTFWQMREVPGGNRCQDDPRAHFGLGDATSVSTVRIEWPSGTVQELTNVVPDQILTVTEPRRPVLAVAVTPTQVTGTLTGDPNTTYEIRSTDDLASGWTLLTTITTDANGGASWSDAGPAPQGHRFYKANRVAE